MVGGGFTAAVTSADGVVFEASQAVDIGAPVLDVAVVATQIQGIVALARKIGTEASGLWKATGPRSSQWQELESQPPALSRAYGAGAVAFAGAALWVAFRNPVRGFEIWSAPWVPGSLVWVKSLEDGAWKWAANSDVYAMTAFGEACYAATGMDDAQQEKLAPFHRRAFELLRIYPGGDWDLLVGTPVFTPGGLRAPLSAKGPGLDQIWNDRVFSLISHAGELFLLGRNLDTLKLWHSQDGESWDSYHCPICLRSGPGARLTWYPRRSGWQSAVRLLMWLSRIPPSLFDGGLTLARRSAVAKERGQLGDVGLDFPVLDGFDTGGAHFGHERIATPFPAG